MPLSPPTAPMPLSRRRAIGLCAGAGAALVMPAGADAAQASSGKLRTRTIPHGGEALPVIGLGTAIVFDVGAGAQQLNGCTDTVRALVAGGGSLIDTAPSYGRAERVIGTTLTDTGLRNRVFLATKLERYGPADVAAELHGSLQRLRTDRVDLLQLHNVRDPNLRLDAVRALQRQGLCRYVGITTTRRTDYAAAAAIIERERPDFIEIDYAIDNRDAQMRVLPAAAAAGTAVVAALPFGRGRLFRAALARKLPPWAAQFDCTSWAQFFLKFILANEAVTAAIPGTDKSAHMTDNLGAGLGRLPDAQLCARMVRLVGSFT